MSAIAFAWWALCLGLLTGSTVLALLQPVLARRRATVPPQPVSVLIPMPVVDAAALAQAVAFRKDQPGVAEVLIGCPAGAAAAQMPAETQVRIVPAEGPATGNPKIANLLKPWQEARHDFVLIRDAGTLMPAGRVAEMAAQLGPHVGLVCAVPVARHPVGAVAAIEAALINTGGGRMVLAAATLGLPVGLGAAMLLRRSDLAPVGGLAAVRGAIADDHALCRLMTRRGLATRYTVGTVDLLLGRRRFAQVWQRHLRWTLCRRTAAPAAFWLEPLTGLPAALLAAGLATGSTGACIATLLAWPLAETVLALVRRWPAGPLLPLAVLAREALQPVLWGAALMTHRIRWGGTDMPVTSWREPAA